MPGDKPAQSPEEGGVCITEALITKRNLAFPEDEDLSEKMFHTLAELQTVRLDREGITTIRNLEGFQNLHSLYLQGNKIERIENLACVPSLRFLSLAGNRIRQVENLRDLPHLQFLDLSENLIEILKLDEFPESLLILNLTGNSCTNQESYRRLVTEALPLLLDLDGQPVAERWTSDEEDQASSNEDEEFPELRGPFCSERGDPAFQGLQPPQSTPLPALWDLGEAKTAVVSGDVVPGPDQSGHAGFLKELEQETSRHREHRQQTALLEHLLRVEMRPALTDLPPLPGAPMAGNSSPSVPPRQGKETSPEPVSLPQASSATKKPCLPASRSLQSTVQAGKGARAAAAAKASPAGAPSTTKTVTEKLKK
ncbi:leucine-rich repeat-containing protein 46 isoform X2 [Orcinus orca]|uniref:leucine-rich repeat-containing protein 46 isoform X2 n=1 Tax=Orcinus orca TaxID=9733 RepID=UPI002113255D|nr:leucine-rich repeat-containing protein 46 isoform X2 [Orcinus orca]XP_049557561.1 leucine-rich repeat-containing protein 46 isoform X2 [Orcinus orca]